MRPGLGSDCWQRPTRRRRHLRRLALVYLRQPTQSQVERNVESTARQYALVDRVVELGFTREQVVVIDEDLGIFGAHLLERGYAPSSAEDQLRLMAHVSRWLDEERQEPAALTPELVGRFLGARRAGYARLTSRRALTPLLEYLQGLGVVRDAPAEMPTAVEALLADYREYLVGERGLAAGTVRLREQVARLFLVGQPEPLELALQQLEPGDVTTFVLAECRSGRRGVSSAKTLTSGLRSLLSFLHLEGWVPPAGAVGAERRRLAACLATARPGGRARRAAAGKLRPHSGSRPPRFRCSDAALAIGAAVLRGGRLIAGRHRLARRGARDSRQGLGHRAAPVA
jgi:hypothetical protein